jgi:hypothetical protein
MRGLYRNTTLLFGLVSIGLGIALLAETIARHGGTVGYLLGVLFIALGLGRIYLLRR